MGFRGCEVCKQEIEADRAEALPETRLCQKHAAEMEADKQRYGGGEFIVLGVQESTTKQGGFNKGSATGVSTKMVRNEEGVRILRDDYLNQ